MNSGSKAFLSWFGYSRRERRSTFILLLILILLIMIRYFLPEKEIKIENLSGLLSSGKSGENSFDSTLSDTNLLFSFDPNTATHDTLILLGFSVNQARTIISYRTKGGKFRNPSDIKKIYGVDEQTAEQVIPFIDIKTEHDNRVNKVAEFSENQGKQVRIDLNKADSAELEKLPGIGPVLSSRIIKYRKLLGGFASKEQLCEVYGLTVETFKMVEGKVFADSSCISVIYINDTGFNNLSRHPYFDKYDILALLKYREIKGRIQSTNELVENKILTAAKAKKISPYLRF